MPIYWDGYNGSLQKTLPLPGPKPRKLQSMDKSASLPSLHNRGAVGEGRAQELRKMQLAYLSHSRFCCCFCCVRYAQVRKRAAMKILAASKSDQLQAALQVAAKPKVNLSEEFEGLPKPGLPPPKVKKKTLLNMFKAAFSSTEECELSVSQGSSSSKEEFERIHWPGLPPPKMGSEEASERPVPNSGSSSTKLPPARSPEKERSDQIFMGTNKNSSSGLRLPPPTLKGSSQLRAPRGDTEEQRQAEFAKRDEERKQIEAEFKMWQRDELQRARDARMNGWDFRTDAQAWQRYDAKVHEFFSALSSLSSGHRRSCFEDIPFPPRLGEGLVSHLCNDPRPSASSIKLAYQQAIRFWHPDKFRARYLDNFATEQHAQIMELVKQVSQTINREYTILTKGAYC